ncbi:GlxA family transcriptional regulator [Ancylobacter dichloromethanicus]|uniref:AraC family transcriptional regulator n=1 Tax=Ancylobacter dichloromethanicus TaxID=518825 RepID=A0A9W6MXY9_9HYPH|nr:GlxA family transcriptional regulator [Ancylobacter dichloromethanicus]MBS7555344.1 GlxA family transcriptional regulator [Ancylobacter dichloromethanicus]GLK70526.1 AraC family transcriptional regulator [Ancylobacter dichloromethanicus]
MNHQRPISPGLSNPPKAVAAPALNVGFILADNFTLSAFSLIVDQLRLAADDGDRSRPILARWQVMSSRPEPIRASCGITVAPSGPFTDPANFAYIVVVGGLLHGGQQLDEESIAYLRRAARAGVPLVGVCTGSFVLARAGLMTGRRCCVSWYHYQDFMEEFPHHTPVADRLYVIDGDRITCAGGGGAADLATALVEKFLGRSIAQKSRHVLLLDRQRPGTESQPHPPIADLVADDRVRRALLMMEQHLADPLPIADISRRLQLSTRQLERLFQTVMGQRPAEFYRRLRLRYARFLLDTTGRSVTDIALEAGFSDCAHFSRQFKAQHGFTPSDARARTPGPPAQSVAGQRLFD